MLPPLLAGLSEAACVGSGLWEVLGAAEDQRAFELAAVSLRARAPFALEILGGCCPCAWSDWRSGLASEQWPPITTPTTDPASQRLRHVCRRLPTRKVGGCLPGSCLLSAGCSYLAAAASMHAGPADRRLTLELRPATADHLSAGMPPVGIPNLMESWGECAGGAAIT